MTSTDQVEIISDGKPKWLLCSTLLMDSQYMLEPTDENLERYQREANGVRYWHTADFFLYDKPLEIFLSNLLDIYNDLLFNSDDVDEETEMRRFSFKFGRPLIQQARELGIAPRDLGEQFDNYATVIWLPVCIWQKDAFGKMGYTLMNNIPTTKATIKKA
ncbi:hypothetical protein [Pseudanabaena sp. FACHB-2040]|uniref:hypothetical protein n=1 Tax=Pseudanabaena sp. FACHB-2040 TaxID=2692859 RepID=UPI001685AEE8|nr:hypothetical protein [Pseudanabaena sp. FACHB-2040]MBD2261113.1 hypothetical protein [Pseudanabaena sp. FACHB-2040]